MRLRSLRVENFRRVRAAELEFPDGLIGIVGRNGMGKSTLVEAILWALFGHEASRTGKELVRWHGAGAAEDVLVELGLEADGRAYRVARRLRGRSQSPEARVESDGELLVAPGAHSWEAASAWASELLGVDRAGLEATCVARQGELTALTDLRPATRKRLLLGMLGVERIEAAIGSVREEARLLAVRVEEARRVVAEEPRVAAERERARAERTEASKALARLVRELAFAARAGAAARERAEGLLRDRLADQRLRLLVQSLGGRQESVWTSRSRVAAELVLVRERVARVSGVRAELEGLGDVDAAVAASEARRAAWESARQVESERSRLETEVRRWHSQVDPALENGSGPSAWEERVRRLREVVRATSARRRAEEDALGLARAERAARSAAAPAGEPSWSADAACPTCGRTLGSLAESLREQSASRRAAEAARVAGLEERVRSRESGLAVVVQEAERSMAQLEEAEAAWREARVRWDASQVARREADRARAALEAMGVPRRPSEPWEPAAHARLVASRTRAAGLREELARLGELQAREARLVEEDRVLDAQDRECARDREAATRDLARLGYVAGAWETARDAASAAEGRVAALDRERVQWEERALARAADANRLEAEWTRLAARRAELGAWESELGLLELLAAARGDRGVLPEFKAHVIGRVRPLLARAASVLVSEMTGGRYAELRLDEEYGALLVDAGTAYPLQRFSGGEADVANLALRLAVSELVANARGRSRVQWVCLDEVFGSQDAERRRLVLDALESLSGVFRQVLVVTHLEDVRERVQHVVRVVDSTDGSSRYEASWDAKA